MKRTPCSPSFWSRDAPHPPGRRARTGREPGVDLGCSAGHNRGRRAGGVGTWTSTGFEISTGRLHETGGAGVRMTIGLTGAGKVVYDGKKPVRSTARPACRAGLTADVAMASPTKVSLKNGRDLGAAAHLGNPATRR